MWQFGGGGEAIYLLDDHWSIGEGSYTQFQDPKAQYAYNVAQPRARSSGTCFPPTIRAATGSASSTTLAGRSTDTTSATTSASDSRSIRCTASTRSAAFVTITCRTGSTLQSDVQLDHPGRRHSSPRRRSSRSRSARTSISTCRSRSRSASCRSPTRRDRSVRLRDAVAAVVRGATLR